MISRLWEGERHSFLVALHNGNTPHDFEWAEYVKLARDFLAISPPERLRGVTVTMGGGPSPKQRAMITPIMSNVRSPAVVFTESALARGVVTALRWASQAQVRAFAFSEQKSAFESIQLFGEERARFIDEMTIASEQIDGVNPVKALLAKT